MSDSRQDISDNPPDYIIHTDPVTGQFIAKDKNTPEELDLSLNGAAIAVSRHVQTVLSNGSPPTAQEVVMLATAVATLQGAFKNGKATKEIGSSILGQLKDRFVP